MAVVITAFFLVEALTTSISWNESFLSLFVQSLSGHTSAVETVKFNHTEELVAAGSGGGVLKIWDLEQAQIVRTLTGHRGGLRAIDFHPYGDFLTSSSLDTTVKVIRSLHCVRWEMFLFYHHM